NLEDDAGEILGVHSQGDCGNVTTDDNEDVTPVIAPEKDSIIAPPSTPPGNELNIAVESGSSWIDYIGPLTSDEIDSDKRWSYRDPNGNILDFKSRRTILVVSGKNGHVGFINEDDVFPQISTSFFKFKHLTLKL
ncbi:hypothetical protein Tco_0914933, partial [Tanacetum coccineum]